MSCARSDHKDPLYGAIYEIHSGQSSLHMPPQLLPVEEVHADDFFLSDVDYHVKHSLEHFKAAVELIGQAERDREKVRRLIYLFIAHGEGSDLGEGNFEKVIEEAKEWLNHKL